MAMANEWIERARGYLAGRSVRERQSLTAGGLILLALLGYGLLYEPLRQERAKLAERLPAQRAELRLMRVQVAEIERLRTTLGDAGKGGLEQRIKSSAAAFGLVDAFTRFTPLTEGQIQLATQPLPHGAWIDWLADLERQGVTVTRCHVSASDEAGLASLELTLTGGRR
jgi:type II secretory pathway component PulM